MLAKLVIPCFTITILLLTKGVEGFQKTVEITELRVPPTPQDGEDVTLTCRFSLGGDDHDLYTVNWWRGKDQFYTYKGNHYDPKNAYTFEGITVAKEMSDRENVVLKNVSEKTSGTFKCEVMGEAPTFRTAVEKSIMEVIVPPKQVEIKSWSHPDHSMYRIGETVNLNCTARGAKPKADITFTINGHRIRDLKMDRYPDFEDHRGRVTSTMGLRWIAPDFFESGVAKVVCMATVAGHQKQAIKDIFLDPASSAAFNHQYASGGCQLSTTWSLLCLASFLLARTCA